MGLISGAKAKGDPPTPTPPQNPPQQQHFQEADARRRDWDEDREVKRRKTENRSSWIMGCRVDKYAEAIIIQFDADMAHNLGRSADHASRLKNIAGRYFLSSRIDGSPIYRQEVAVLPDQINNEQLFLWRHDRLDDGRQRGWYITKWLGAEWFDAYDNIKAWGLISVGLYLLH